MLKLDVMAGTKYCNRRIYPDLPLSMAVLQGWFNDQHKCFEVFLEALSERQRQSLFDEEEVFDSVKGIYREMWSTGQFEKVAIRDKGVHRRFEHLVPSSRNRRGFLYWATCVFREVGAGGLAEFMGQLRTVEEAHRKFKPWFYMGDGPIRGLNAADAARILAGYGYLEPEARPLLARGALRGAAILLDCQPASRSIDQVELEYDEESTRIALEEKAAEYIAGSEEFSGRFQMEKGESWFCDMHKAH